MELGIRFSERKMRPTVTMRFVETTFLISADVAPARRA